AMPFAFVIHYFLSDIALIFAAFLLFIIGIKVSNRYMAMHRLGHDPSAIVLDEVVGIWLLLAMMPLTLNAYILGFLAFRFFDIAKPWPICSIDKRLRGGTGVMLDDVIAAIYPVALTVLASFIMARTGTLEYKDMFFAWLNSNAF
ncbi:MAG: phosphatidylglycerophosphatase A, partial [Rickettsiales bacterium]